MAESVDVYIYICMYVYMYIRTCIYMHSSTVYARIMDAKYGGIGKYIYIYIHVHIYIY